MKSSGTSFKDLFSRQANQYAKYRPTYPKALFDWVSSLAKMHDRVWDCGTGNGQAAAMLAQHFKQVIATDPSEKQLQNAEKRPNIEYRKATAEQSGLEPQSIDLITVAQAYHWFNHDLFFAEARRVAKEDCTLVVWSYEMAKITPEVDAVVDRLYRDILGDYWEAQRKHVEAGYSTLPFPFQKTEAPHFEMKAQWSYEHLVGYLETWSATQAYIAKNGKNPIDLITSDLQTAWSKQKSLTDSFAVTWDLNIKAGRVHGP